MQALQGRLNHLESKAYCFELPNELKIDPERFHYPPRVANFLSALKEMERRGGGLVRDVENRDDDDEESAQGTSEGSAQDSWASGPEEEGDKEVRSEPWLPPPPSSTVAILPGSSTAPTFNAAPAPSLAPALSLAP
ncbi:uncharacterized protein A4U43_C08F13930 [Asparagus officinalis]|nr:uncharacterized protein A4U43_C08F13930 [Asparagus officinalis]